MEIHLNTKVVKFLKKLHIINKKADNFTIKIHPNIHETITRAFVSFLLLGMDFILFVGAGNFSIFDNFFLSNEVAGVLIIIAMTITAIYAVFSKIRIAQDILMGFSVFAFFYALYSQFAQFNAYGFIADWFSLSANNIFHQYSALFVSLLFGIAAFYLYYKKKQYIMGFTFFVFLLFCSVLLNKFIIQNKSDEFIVTYDDNTGNNIGLRENQKAVYFFFPEASSYKTLSTWENLPEAKETIELMLAFYVKNKFKLFSNAYIKEKTQYFNLINSLNPQYKGDVTDNIMRTKILYRYWKFFNPTEEFIYPKNSKLIETYTNSGYKTTAYKSRIVDLCTEKHEMKVNRCVEKVSVPVNFYGKNIDYGEKVKIILAEWAQSTGLFAKLPFIYNALNLVYDADKIPLVGINYNNLYVINSTHTFDALLEDIKKDKGNQAYFVFVDLPADMYIYNEFCEIKPISGWVSLNAASRKNTESENLKKKAYLEQVRCMYGKLEEFIQALEKENLLNKTTLLIQGTSSFHKDKFGIPFTDNFINSRLVNMAYREEDPYDFEVNDYICSTSDILNSILYGADHCTDLEDVNTHITVKFKLYKKLTETTVNKDYLLKMVPKFDKWFEVWKEKNKQKYQPKKINNSEIKELLINYLEDNLFKGNKNNKINEIEGK